jgi:hypothetical protein
MVKKTCAFETTMCTMCTIWLKKPVLLKKNYMYYVHYVV